MAGEHKCPLCPATFTRPQHVGRHLRAHTGDRPYECKECPLRFARSDLLSRHVNKAHRTPEPGEPKKEGKKGRRKSLPSSARKPSLTVDAAAEVSGDGVGGEAMQAQTSGASSGSNQAQSQARASAEAKERARRASFDYPHPPQLQAQRMYPNHPLLAGTPSPMAWNTPGLNGLVRSPVNTFDNAVLGTPVNSAGFHPGLASPVRWPGADLGAGSSAAMTRNESNFTSSSYNEFGIKKRACDQCNHSKVRCDFAHPCTRCSHRNVHCSYNKPPKSRTLPITPGLSYPMTAMPSGTSLSLSLSPVSHFSSPPHAIDSPVGQQMYQIHPQGQMLNSLSPVQQGWSNGSPDQVGVPAQPTTQWVDLSGSAPGLQYTTNNGQALGMYMSSPHSQQPVLNATTSVPITQQYPEQLSNSGSSTSPPVAMMATPSLTSHTTSPSSSDEPTERKSSLVGNMASLPLPPPSTAPTTKGYTPPSAIEIQPQPLIIDQSTAGSMYHWPTSAFTVDPRSQFRNPTLIAQSDDETDQNPHSSSASVFGDDEPIYDAQRRASTGVWSAAFNSMSLQDGSQPNSATVPDPYTAVQVAQRATQPRPSFPMVTLNETAEPTKMPSMTDAKDVWKLFMQDPQGMSGVTPKQEKREHDTGMPMVTPRPGMGRSLSKSNSMPDLKSPSLANNQIYLSNGVADGSSQQQSHQPQQQQHQQQQQGGATAAETNHPNDDAHRQNWHNQIQQRQASFNIQPGGKFGRNGGFPSNTGSEMLPPPFYGRPMASIIQHPGALQQTLAPERAPSFGLTPNAEKPNPTGNANVNITPPQSAGLGTWSRTPSKLAQRATLTSSQTRPGNKRLLSQTPGPEAKKRSASFSMWDEGEGDDGTLGDIEDGDNRSQYAFNPSNYLSNGNGVNGHGGFGGQTYGHGHSRSSSLGTNQGFDLSMFATTPGLSQMANMGGYNVPMPMPQGGTWSSTT